MVVSPRRERAFGYSTVLVLQMVRTGTYCTLYCTRYSQVPIYARGTRGERPVSLASWLDMCLLQYLLSVSLLFDRGVCL